jgi:hypothetical protein
MIVVAGTVTTLAQTTGAYVKHGVYTGHAGAQTLYGQHGFQPLLQHTFQYGFQHEAQRARQGKQPAPT